MNPAIDKLEERIEAATAYPQTVKDLTALKACVEALEEIKIKAEAHKEWVTCPNSHWECLYCHQVNGKHSAACIYTAAKAATSIVNRVMGISQ